MSACPHCGLYFELDPEWPIGNIRICAICCVLVILEPGPVVRKVRRTDLLPLPMESQAQILSAQRRYYANVHAQVAHWN